MERSDSGPRRRARPHRGPKAVGDDLDSPDEDDGARETLSEGLRELGLATTEAQLNRLLGLASLLAQWSQRMNLTSHRTLDGIVRRLILDAAALSSHIPPVPSLVDIGSGAGFPGLPFAVLRPVCRVTLVEAREKRHHFQRAAMRELGLDNVTPERGRAEELTPHPHDAVIAQALAPPERSLPWMLPWVQVGGLVLLPASSAPPEVPPRSDLRFEECVHYRVPCSGVERTLWIGRRITP